MYQKLFVFLLFLFLSNTLCLADVNEIIETINKTFVNDENEAIINRINEDTFIRLQHKKQVQNTATSTKTQHSRSDDTNIVITKAADTYDINPNVLYALIVQESNFRPLCFNLNAIDTTTLKTIDMLKNNFEDLKVNTYFQNQKQYASLSFDFNEANVQKAKIVFETLMKQKVNFDSSYMQINSQHYSRLKLSSENIFNPFENINAGAKIYKECEERYNGDMLKSVECYNKGSYRGKTPYFDRFYKTYRKLISA